MTSYKMFTPSGSTRKIKSLRSARNRSNTQQPMARGRATSACWGPIGARKQLPGSCAVLRIGPRIFGKVAELRSRSAVITTQKPKTKRGFYPIFVRVWEYIVMSFGDVGL